MDSQLVEDLIERDWAPFSEQARRLGLGAPVREGARATLKVSPHETEDEYLAVLFLDGYDAQAPLLDFADPGNPEALGGPHWPRMAGATMNHVSYRGRVIPIICTPGTRGYHLHSSHSSEAHPRSTWALPQVATLIARFLTWGPYQGRGV